VIIAAWTTIGQWGNRLMKLMCLAALGLTVIKADGFGEIIERTMAVVGTQPILLSDVTAARLFQLVQPDPDSKDPMAAVLNRLIERTLILVEVERYQPPEPAVQEIDRRFAEIARRFASTADFETALKSTGMTTERLREYIRDDLRIATYLNQRFSTAADPSDAEVLAYYREHPAEFTANGVLQPFEAVAAGLRSRLAEMHRKTMIAEWTASLRRRAEVNVLYLPKES
jgi:hypothetical protein